MKITPTIKKGVKRLAKKHKLKFVILYGSHATGQANKYSDIDIAVYGFKDIPPNTLCELYNDFSELFRERNIDVKTLHDTNPLFRFNVTDNGILLYGDSTDYAGYQAYAFRDYIDSKSLRELNSFMIKKRLKMLEDAK